MYCKNCGEWNNYGTQTCVKCGSPIITTKPVQKTKRSNILGLVASVALLASAFLPLFSVSAFGAKVSRALIDDSDWIIIVLLAALGIWFSVKNRGVELIICGVLGFAYFLYVTYSIKNSLSASAAGSELVASLAQSMIERDLGYFALLFGSAGLAIAGTISLVKK